MARQGHTEDFDARRPWEAVALRMLADVLLVLGATAIALALDAWWRSNTEPAFPYSTSEWIWAHWSGALWLVAVCLVVFWFYGFYARNRRYRLRYKALAVIQGAATAFVVFAAAGYALRAYVTLLPAIVILTSGLIYTATSLVVRVRPKGVLRWFERAADLEAPTQPSAQNSDGHVLVIGGAGYIGSALLPLLLHQGFRVRILDNLSFGPEAIASWLSDDRVQLIEGDFRRVDQLVEQMKGASAVVHLGGIVGDPACALDPDLTVEINLIATRLVAEVAKAEGVDRFIFASSCSVYGASDEVLSEKSSLNPVSLYAQTKVASEVVLKELTDNKFRPTILRLGTVFGLSGRTRFDLVVNLLTGKAVRDGEITVFGPTQWRPFIHVEDVARAIALSLTAPMTDVGAQTFNVGSNEMNCTLGDVALAIQKVVPTASIIESQEAGDPRNYRVDFTKIEKALRFAPKWSLPAGIQQVADLMTTTDSVEYDSPRFSNVKSLELALQNGGPKTVRDRDLNFLSETRGY